MIGQTAERLGADDVVRPRFGKRRHLGGNQPAFPHLHPLVDDLVGAVTEMFEIVNRLERSVFQKLSDDLLLHPVQNSIKKLIDGIKYAFMSVEFSVVDVVDDAVQNEVHQSGNDGLAPLRKEEFFKMVVAEISILDINFADDPDFDLPFLLPLDRRKDGDDFRRDFFVLSVFLFRKRVVDQFHCPISRRIRRALFRLVGFGLVVAPHDVIAVKDGESQLQKQFDADGERGILFQPREIERQNGNVGELRL